MTDISPPSGDASNAPLPMSEELARYTLTSSLEIAHHLRRIINAGQMVTVFSNHGKSFILTRLLAVDTRQNLLIFDMGSDGNMNRLLLTSERNVLVCAPEGVKTQFSVGRVKETTYEGAPAFVTNLPTSLIKLQRREYFRIRTPIASPVMCNIHDYDEGNGVTLPIYDISLGGVSLVTPEDLPGFDVTQIYSDVALDLKQAGTVPVVIEVRNILRIPQRNNTVQVRVGCEFKDLSMRGQTIIQKYIAQLERERRAMERD